MSWKPRVITWLENVCSYYFRNHESSNSKAVQENTLALIEKTLKTKPAVARKEWQNLIFAAFLVSVEVLGLQINDKDLWEKCEATCDPEKVREMQKLLVEAEPAQPQQPSTSPKLPVPPAPPSTMPASAKPATAKPATAKPAPPPIPTPKPATAVAAPPPSAVPATAKPATAKPAPAPPATTEAAAPPATPAKPATAPATAKPQAPPTPATFRELPVSEEEEEEEAAERPLYLGEEEDAEDIKENRQRVQKEKANNNYIHTVHDDSFLRVWPYVFDVELSAHHRKCVSRVFRTYAISIQQQAKTKEEVQNIAAATLLAVLEHFGLLPHVKPQRLINKLYDDYPLSTRKGIHQAWQAIKAVPGLLAAKCQQQQ